MYFPTWIDLKGQDSVPETVHHCVSKCCLIQPCQGSAVAQW